MERAGDGVNVNRGIDVCACPCPKTPPYTGEDGHLNGDPGPECDPDPGAEGAPRGSSNTQGVACVNEGRDQRGGLAGADAPVEECE